jgi:hypothetical protein
LALPGAQRDVGGPSYRVGIAGPSGVDHRLHRAGDGTDECADDGPSRDVVELVGVGRTQMARDLALRFELQLEGRAAHGRHGLDEPEPQCALRVGELVASLDHRVQGAAHRADPPTALRAYEHQHRRLVTPRQRWMGAGSRLIVPATSVGVVARNAAMRLVAARS